MLEELQLLNYWLASKDPAFLQKYGLDVSFFFALNHVAVWVAQFQERTGVLPTIETVTVEFEDFRELTDLDPIEYLVAVLKENKAFVEIRPLITESVELVNEGKTLEAIWKIRDDMERLIRKYNNKTVRYDWVKDAPSRFERYLENHGKEGLKGLTTGIPGLDEATGGWREDDLILLSARTGEGKSFWGVFFAYTVWLELKKAGSTRPVVYISTEMPEIEVAYRLDTLRSHLSNRALNDGQLPDPSVYKEYLEELAKSSCSFIILSEEANGGRPFTPNDIRAIIEVEKPAFIVVDQLYDISDGFGETDIRKRIVSVSNQIRDINLATKTPTLLIAQSGRGAAREAKKNPDATPELYDIQESDNPAQKATRVLTLRLIGDVFKLSLKKNRRGKRGLDFYVKVDLDKGIWAESPVETSVF